MILSCTKKLFAKLLGDIKVAKSATSSIFAQVHWINGHANFVTTHRSRCIIAVHETTLFMLFISQLPKKNLANLDGQFTELFINNLLKSDMPLQLVNVAATNCQTLAPDTDCNRLVKGTMNQMIQKIDYWLYYNITSVANRCAYRYSADLSDRPCGVKGQKDYIWPDREMAQLLKTLDTKNNIAAEQLH